MSFIADKKREHEAAAEKALIDKDYAKAFFHTAKAAEFGLTLAEQSEGKIAERYVEDAFELIRIAEKLKERGKAAPERVAGGDSALDYDVAPGDAPPWLLRDKPDVTFDDIIGLEDLKTRIKRFVAKFRNPEEVSKWPGARLGDRMILVGPPGTGKTMFAKAIAHEIAADFFLVKGSNILDKWVGESQKNVKRLFDAVRRSERSVVFLDEIDGILSKRGSKSTVRDGVVSEFLQEMEGLTSPNTAILFIGATNLPTALDQAAISRFGGMFLVPLPPREARLALLEREFKKFPYGHDEAISLEELADRLDRHSMRSLTIMVQTLIDRGIMRKIEGGDGRIAKEDVASALGELPPPMSLRGIKAYETLAERSR
jgi:transitional endoplasmic reticulum ATPase